MLQRYIRALADPSVIVLIIPREWHPLGAVARMGSVPSFLVIALRTANWHFWHRFLGLTIPSDCAEKCQQILITSRKLRLYFDEFKISVVTDFPLGDILHNRYATGRISKWAVELGALELKFTRRTTIKSQVLVDFLAEWRENQVSTPPSISDHWTIVDAH
jgi:hypothetical protein